MPKIIFHAQNAAFSIQQLNILLIFGIGEIAIGF